MINETNVLDAVNYKNGQKNNWRRTMWNVVAKEITDRKTALILYLPGAADLDRSEAIRRGFKPANMIAVERDAEVAEELRNKGVTTIRGKLNAILENWPERHPVDVVIADFQCGFNNDTSRTIEILMTSPAFDGAVVVINMQRGRDVPMHEEAVGGILLANGADLYAEGELNTTLTTIRGTNRILSANSWVQQFLIKDIEALQTKGREQFLTMGHLTGGIPKEYGECTDVKLYSPEDSELLFNLERCTMLPSYRSSKTVFDSAVWHVKSFLPRYPLPVLNEKQRRKMRWKIAAALAIRTQRLQGKLRRT